MAGAVEDRVACALAAGCDMVLVCNDRVGAKAAIQSLKKYRMPLEKSKKMIEMRRTVEHKEVAMDVQRYQQCLQTIEKVKRQCTLV